MNTDLAPRSGFAAGLDRAIAAVAPGLALRRLEARTRIAAAELSLRRFDGATTGRRGRGWITSNGSANAEAQTGLSRLRSRSRDLTRNNSWASKAVEAWASNAVGGGIVPSFQVPGSSQMGDVIGEAFESWATSTDCDPEGRLTFYGTQALAVREIIEAGEVLFRYRTRRSSDGFANPLQLQALEADFLDDFQTGPAGVRGRKIQGVEFGPIGSRVAYHLFRDHPGEVSYPVNLSSHRIPASNILHVFQATRFGQARGVPRGAPCMLTLRDFDQYTDATLMRVKIAAMLVGFVVSTDPDDMANSVSDPGDSDEFTGSQDFQPGTWEHLPLGRDIRFSNPPSTDEFEEYATVTLRQVAAGFSVPYEVLTGDLSRTNFHSGRMGRMEFSGELDSLRKLCLIPQFCNPVLRRWTTLAVLSGQLPEQAAHAAVTWTPPAPRMIEPGREVRAQKDAIRSGLTSRSAVIRERGEDPARVFREISEEQDKLRELGIAPEDTPLPPDEDELEEDDLQLEDDADEETDADRQARLAKARKGELDLERDPAS